MSLANVLGCVAAALYIPPSDPVVNFSNVTNVSQFIPVVDESGHMTFTHNDPPLYTLSNKFGVGGWLGRSAYDCSAKANDPTPINLSNSDFTIEFWYKAAAEPSSSSTVLSRWGTSGNRCWYIYYEPSGNRWRFLASTDGAATTVAINYDFDMESNSLATAFDGNWHHVAVTRNSGTIQIFFDGDLATGASSSYNISTTALFDGGTYPFLVGAATISNLNPTAGWVDYIDEVRITVGTARYTADFTPPTAKLGRNSTDDIYWSNVKLLMGMDTVQALSIAGSGTNTFNYVANGQAGVGITSDGFARRTSVIAPYFSAESSYLLGSDDFTIEIFGLVDSATYASGGQALGVRRSGTSGEYSWAIIYNSTGTKFQFVYSTDGSTETAVDFTGISVTTNTYYNLAVSREGSNLYLYVNGTLVNTHSIGSATLYAATTTPLGVMCGMNSAILQNAQMNTTCRMKAFRITKGAYRYHLSSYTVPTLPLPTS